MTCTLYYSSVFIRIAVQLWRTKIVYNYQFLKSIIDRAKAQPKIRLINEQICVLVTLTTLGRRDYTHIITQTIARAADEGSGEVLQAMDGGLPARKPITWPRKYTWNRPKRISSRPTPPIQPDQT